MKFNSIYERYIPALHCTEGDIHSSIVFLANADQLVIKSKGEEIAFPGLEDFGPGIFDAQELDYLGNIDCMHCFCLPYDPAMVLPDGMEFRSLRAMYGVIDDNLALVASRAVHIAGWSKKNRFCGACGEKMQKVTEERARKCPACGNIVYPRISPAIIIAVVKGEELLLAHNRNFRGGWYSTVAGFMEPGETIEDCAEREIFEEVGIRIKNIQYFASQPWPFPDSLMIGLTAEYESGELRPDGEEIDDAGFFRVDALPDTPGKTSVAGKLIGWFVDNHRQ